MKYNKIFLRNTKNEQMYLYYVQDFTLEIFNNLMKQYSSNSSSRFIEIADYVVNVTSGNLVKSRDSLVYQQIIDTKLGI